MRLCLQCRYCEVAEAVPDWSDMTPGSPPKITCDKYLWYSEDFFLGTQKAFEMLKTAETCSEFAPADWAKAAEGV